MNQKPAKLICVDFQRDFAHEQGEHFKPRPSVGFTKDTLVPFLREHDIRLAEIISDYRQPRPGRRQDFCRPGTDGYLSEIPNDVKDETVWIKAANSPLWTRKHIGDASKEPGVPYEDPAALGKWLETVAGPPEGREIILCGLTLDRCVLATALELYFRAYPVYILKEAVDTFSGDQTEKVQMLEGQIINNWAKPIDWATTQKKLLAA